MQATLPTPEQAIILNRFFEAGGIVDFVFVDSTEGDDLASEETHREAILLGMKSLQERLGYFPEFAVTTVKGKLGSIPVPLEIDEPRCKELRGSRISLVDFLGSCFDEGCQTLKPDVGPDLADGNGFAYAFAGTPYGLWIPAKQRQNLFDEVVSTVLGGINGDSIILEWPTDWSSYFDAGREWWSCFLWTFSNPATNRIIMIAASTTD